MSGSIPVQGTYPGRWLDPQLGPGGEAANGFFSLTLLFLSLFSPFYD